MIKTCSLIILIAYVASQPLAQSVSTVIGARSVGMGGISVALDDASSAINNIGALARSQKATFFVGGDVQPALPGANKVVAMATLPTHSGVIGFSLFRFGDNFYNEFVIGAGFSQKIGNSSLGIRASYVQYYNAVTGSKGVFRFDFGGLTSITPQILVGAYILNLSQTEFSDNRKLPTKFFAGIGFNPTDKVLISTEIEKMLGSPAIVKVGAEYIIYKKIFIRTGFNLAPISGHFGFGFWLKNFTIDYAMKMISPLGIVYSASGIYTIKKRTKR